MHDWHQHAVWLAIGGMVHAVGVGETLQRGNMATTEKSNAAMNVEVVDRKIYGAVERDPDGRGHEHGK
jgi:hypothetical protein